VLAALDRAIAATGRPVVVDSSKRLGQAEHYSRLEAQGGVRLIPVVLVRDYRSWLTSSKVSANYTGGPAARYIRSAWHWMARNRETFAGMRRLGLEPTVLRYEDFVADPSGWLAPVFERAGLEPAEVDQPSSCQHALKGNTMRWDPKRNSQIVVQEDWRDDWRMRWLAPLVFGPALYNELLRRVVRAGRRRDVPDSR